MSENVRVGEGVVYFTFKNYKKTFSDPETLNLLVLIGKLTLSEVFFNQCP